MDETLRHAAKEYLVRYGGDQFPNLFRAAKGSVVFDDTGREILDFTSGQMCATIGHNHPAIVAAVHEAGEKAFHFFSGMIPEVVAELGPARAGLDARRSSIDLRQHRLREQRGRAAHGQDVHRRLRGPGGGRLLARHHRRRQRVSFASDRKGYGVPAPGVFVMPEPNAYRPYIQGLSARPRRSPAWSSGLKMFDMESTGRRAAIIVEPIISAGGVLVPPKSYMQALRKAADDRGMLLIFDEAQTAFGRIGSRTGSDFFGVVPDIMTLSKTMGGGLPLAAVATTPRSRSAPRARFTFYTSHVSDPLPATSASRSSRRSARRADRTREDDRRLSARRALRVAGPLRGDRRRARRRPAARRRARQGSRVARRRITSSAR